MVLYDITGRAEPLPRALYESVIQLKKIISQTAGWFILFLVLFSAGSLFFAGHSVQRQTADWVNPYADITEDTWCYQYVTELNKMGVLPDSEEFGGAAEETRGNLMLYLYNLENAMFGDRAHSAGSASFSDVEKSDARYKAICWAFNNGVSGGTGDTTFSPDGTVSRQQLCTILARFAALEEMNLLQIKEPDQFTDSLYIADYARSGVTACQICGVVRGYEDGYFHPENIVSRQECAALIYRLYDASRVTPVEGMGTVSLVPNAYDVLYESYHDIPFVALVPQTAEGPLSYFDKTVFIGDSISQMLESYAGATGSLGGAQFLCAGSMSPTNMLAGKILPEYPKGSGQHPVIEESVAACGAQVVYIMLGMDNIAYGVDYALGDLLTIIGNIQARNPDVQIVMQSVTPMADYSSSYSERLNNNTIDQYNAKLQEYCQENKWYYINVQEVFKGPDGFLIKDYCSDLKSMGMHFNYTGSQVWVDYLKTHIPAALL